MVGDNPETTSENEEEERQQLLLAIERDLTEVEHGLESTIGRQTTRRRRLVSACPGGGRAAFASVSSVLGSIGSRLLRLNSSALRGGDEENTTTQQLSQGNDESNLDLARQEAENANAIATGAVTATATASALQRISERFRIAQHAHTERIPLALLRGSNTELMRSRESSRACVFLSASFTSIPTSSHDLNRNRSRPTSVITAERYKEEDSAVTIRAEALGDEGIRGTASIGEISTGSDDAPASLCSGSTLVASRVRAGQVLGMADAGGDGGIEAELVELRESASSLALLPAVTEARESISSDDMLDDDDDGPMTKKNRVAEDLQVKETEKDCPILMTEAMRLNLLSLSRSTSIGSVSGSVNQIRDNAEIAVGSTSSPADDQTASSVVDSSAGSIVYSWGSGIQSLHDDVADKPVLEAQLGSKSRLCRPKAPGVISAAAGQFHSAVANSRGEVLTCGRNLGGCVDPYKTGGDGEDSIIKRPALLESLVMGRQQRFIQVACGLDHTAALSSNGSVMTWGSNRNGQLGHKVDGGNGAIEFCPPRGMSLGGGRRAAAVSCGHGFTLVLTTRMSALVCGIPEIAGCDPSDELDGSFRPKSIPALEGLPLVSIATGHKHALVLTSHGTAFAWGDNETGCCGRPYPKDLSHPVPVKVPSVEEQKTGPFPNWAYWDGGGSDGGSDGGSSGGGVVSLAEDVAVVHAACGNGHTVLVTKSGRLLVCGLNDRGQLGFSIKIDKEVKDEHLSSSSTAYFYSPAVEDQSCAHTISPAKPVDHPKEGRKFVTAEAGERSTILLDDAGDVWRMGDFCPPSSSSLLQVGLGCVLAGKKIITIAAGGNAVIAIAEAEVSSFFESKSGITNHRTMRRQFSISSPDALATWGDATAPSDSASGVRTVEALLNEVSKEEARENDTCTGGTTPAVRQLASATEELLKYPSVLNSVFLDPSDLYRLHLQLLSAGNQGNGEFRLRIRQSVASAVERGISSGLEGLKAGKAKMLYPEVVRCLLVYMQFFDRGTGRSDDDSKNKDPDDGISFDVRGECITSLCDAILALPFEGYRALLSWVATIYSRTQLLQTIIHPLLYQLDRGLGVDIDEDGVEHHRRSLRAVPLIVAVLRCFYKMSERAATAAAVAVVKTGSDNDACKHDDDVLTTAQLEDFYCEGISRIPVQTLYEDLARYKKSTKEQRATHFFLCANPFLLRPEAKRNLLHMENEVEMLKIATQNIQYDEEKGAYTIDPFFVLEVERENLLTGALDAIRKVDSMKLRKNLKVVFQGEEGVDAGGVTKEFFQLLSEELFDVKSSGMWSSRFGDEENGGVNWFNSECTWDQEGYELVGVLVGLAIYNGVLLNVHFPNAVYRKLLRLQLGLEDVVDSQLKSGLRKLLDYEGDDVEQVFCLNFDVTWTDLGKEQTVELKEKGSQIPVTSDNREEYVLLYVKWLLVDSIQPQWEAFERGVLRVMEGSSLWDLFRAEELELLVVGTPVLDFAALRQNTTYEGGYEANSDVVTNFWKFAEHASRDDKVKLLKFATGSGTAPIGGLGELPFKVQRAGPDSMQLPTSHTCFNTLLLPDYGKDFEKLKERLGRAILECEGFGLQ